MENFEQPYKTGAEKVAERLPLWRSIITESSAPEELKTKLINEIEEYGKDPYPDWDRTYRLKMAMGSAIDKAFRTPNFTKEDALALFTNLFDDISDFSSELYGRKPDPNLRIVGPNKRTPPLQE